MDLVQEIEKAERGYKKASPRSARRTEKVPRARQAEIEASPVEATEKARMSTFSRTMGQTAEQRQVT